MKWHENVYSGVFWVADHKSSVIIAKLICLNNLTCKMKKFSLTFNLRYQGHTVHLPLLRKTHVVPRIGSCFRLGADYDAHQSQYRRPSFIENDSTQKCRQLDSFSRTKNVLRSSAPEDGVESFIIVLGVSTQTSSQQII